MRALGILTLAIALTSAMGTSAAAQTTITIDDPDAARASIKASYGGHGIDWAASLDGPLLAEFVRFRADIGYGRWVGLGETNSPSGLNPPVTHGCIRAGADLHVRAAPQHTPHDVDMDAQRGVRLTFGLDALGDRWTIGQEVELDIPHTKGLMNTGQDLMPSVRVGIALRRHF
jgi:hypothetical protein